VYRNGEMLASRRESALFALIDGTKPLLQGVFVNPLERFAGQIQPAVGIEGDDVEPIG
jgi:hypothetical protein